MRMENRVRRGGRANESKTFSQGCSSCRGKREGERAGEGGRIGELAVICHVV